MSSIIKQVIRRNPASYRAFIEQVKYNVPFGYLDNKHEFRSFVNIDIDEEGEYVYYQYGNKYSIPLRIAKEKKVPIDEWFAHLYFIDKYGRAFPLHNLSIE
jgi:hypothetical protein